MQGGGGGGGGNGLGVSAASPRWEPLCKVQPARLEAAPSGDKNQQPHSSCPIQVCSLGLKGPWHWHWVSMFQMRL